MQVSVEVVDVVRVFGGSTGESQVDFRRAARRVWMVLSLCGPEAGFAGVMLILVGHGLHG